MGAGAAAARRAGEDLRLDREAGGSVEKRRSGVSARYGAYTSAQIKRVPVFAPAAVAHYGLAEAPARRWRSAWPLSRSCP